MEVEQRYDWPLAGVKARLGKEYTDVMFCVFIQLLTLPFVVNAFSKHSKQSIKTIFEVISDLVSMLFEPQRHAEMEKGLSHVNRAHASRGIPNHQILVAFAILAVTLHDWLKDNTTIQFDHQEEQNLLQGLSTVGRIMKVGETPTSIAEYRDVIESNCSTTYCPIAKHLLHKGVWVYWKVRGVKNFPFAFIIFTAGVPTPYQGVFGIPRLPATFYSMVKKMLRVRWGIRDLLYAKNISK